MDRFQPAVRHLIGDAFQAAKADAGSGEAAAALGMALLAHDQFGAAAKAYARASALDPKQFRFLYYWGAALAAEGKHAEAIVPLRRALALDKTSVTARARLADALLESGDVEEARQTYRAVLKEDPNLPTALYGLGRTLTGEEAIAAFRKALDLFPRYGAAQFALASAYRKLGRTAEAGQTLAGYEQNRIVAPALEDPLMDAVADMNRGATGLLRKAQVLEREGRLEEAAQACERALEQDRKLDQAWVNLISLYGRLGQAEKVENAYRQAVEIAPNRADAHYNYGVFCFERGRFEEARKAFERTIAVEPRHAQALHNLGSVVERTGALDRAAELYRRAIAAQPGYRTAHFHLGRIYANQRRFNDAIAEFEKLLEPADEQTPTYLYALAATHARAGHREQALQFMQKAQAAASSRGQAALLASIERDLKSVGSRR